ncbi:DUF2695 domain-containing protein [Aliikangiella sp. G2MR2-5]|uniref:DUF2695 domain-containing protein n=1 Tax=Aliikangiella sp. G2MR2-5 TaxID=2788943 RepID=UPI0018AB5C47|nr:DUF2695 domain-containing protein [Aliikangiella sp. G2MR2-5]
MVKLSKKQQREAAIKAEIEKREKEKLEKSPISKHEYVDLYRFVGKHIVENGHSHDYTAVKGWCSKNAVDFRAVSAFFDFLGIKDDWALLVDGDPYSLFGADSNTTVWMPLSEDELNELLDFLDEELQTKGCDHTMALTETWLSQTKLDKSEVIAALWANGGFCDCEVTYNVEPEGILI